MTDDEREVPYVDARPCVLNSVDVEKGEYVIKAPMTKCRRILVAQDVGEEPLDGSDET